MSRRDQQACWRGHWERDASGLTAGMGVGEARSLPGTVPRGFPPIVVIESSQRPSVHVTHEMLGWPGSPTCLSAAQRGRLQAHSQGQSRAKHGSRGGGRGVASACVEHREVLLTSIVPALILFSETLRYILFLELEVAAFLAPAQSQCWPWPCTPFCRLGGAQGRSDPLWWRGHGGCRLHRKLMMRAHGGACLSCSWGAWGLDWSPLLSTQLLPVHPWPARGAGGRQGHRGGSAGLELSFLGWDPLTFLFPAGKGISGKVRPRSQNYSRVWNPVS